MSAAAEGGGGKRTGTCARCGAEGEVMQCSGCHGVDYCDKACQRLDWKESHKNSCAQLAKQYTAEKSKCASKKHNEGRYEGSRRQFQKVVQVQRDLCGSDNAGVPDLAASLLSMGLVLTKEGKYPEALKSLTEALLLYRKLHGSEHEDSAKALVGVGTVYLEQGKYDLALRKLHEALGIQRRVPGREDVVATTLNITAFVLWKQEKLSEALECFEEAIRISEALPNQFMIVAASGIAQASSNIGCLHHSQGRHSEAIEGFEKGLSWAKKIHGPDHPDVAKMLGNIASSYTPQGKYSEALSHYKEALRINKKMLGEDHPSVGWILGNMSKVFSNQGKHSKAVKSANEALRIARKTFGDEHAKVAPAHSHVASAYAQCNEFSKALEHDQDALRIYKKARDDHAVALLHNNVAIMYRNLGRSSEALESFKESLRISKMLLGDDHPDVAETYSKLASVYHDLGQFSDALKHLEIALKILREDVREGVGAESLEVAEVQRNMAEVYSSQGCVKKAKGMFKACAKTYARVYGTADSRTQEAVRLAR